MDESGTVRCSGGLRLRDAGCFPKMGAQTDTFMLPAGWLNGLFTGLMREAAGGLEEGGEKGDVATLISRDAH